MKVVNNIVRHYWKYDYVTWTQPVLTSNTSYGETTSSGYYESQCQPYTALDGVKSGSPSKMQGWIPGTTTAWWKWKLPVKIKITAIKYYNTYVYQGPYCTGQFFADEDCTIPVTDEFTTNYTSWQSYDLTTYETVTDTLYFRKTAGQTYGGIGELEITATEQSIVEGTAEDYDFYTDDVETCLPMETVRHYWKNVEVDWPQPVLTSNTSYGTLSAPAGAAGSSFPAYYAFDNNLADAKRYESTAIPSLMVWTLPREIKVTSIDFYNKYGSASTTQLQLFADSGKTKALTSVIYPNTGAKALTTIEIPEENQQYSNQFVVNFIYGGVSGNYRFVGAQEIYIHALMKTVIAGTSTDYDFYTDDDVYSGIKY